MSFYINFFPQQELIMKGAVVMNTRKIKKTILAVFGIAALLCGVANADITTGLIGHWTFDGYLDGDPGPTGTKGGAGGATYAPGAPGAVGQAAINKAILLDGVDDYISFGHTITNYTDMTIAFWAYFTTEPLHGTSLYKTDYTGAWTMGQAMLGVQNVGNRDGTDGPGPWTYIVGASGMQPWNPTQPWNEPEFKYYATTDMFNDVGRWYHIVFTWDAGNSPGTDNVAKLYIDGNLMAQGSPSQDYDQGFTLAPATLGASMWLGTPGGFFAGRIDDLRIYNRVVDIECDATIEADADGPYQIGPGETVILDSSGSWSDGGYGIEAEEWYIAGQYIGDTWEEAGPVSVSYETLTNDLGLGSGIHEVKLEVYAYGGFECPYYISDTNYSTIEISCVYHIDANDGNDLNNGLSKETAFAMIQTGINTAVDGETVLVWPGEYTESLSFVDKAITVKSAADAAILEATGLYGVSFYTSEGKDSVLSNFVIRNSGTGTGILVSAGSPTISNITLVDNGLGIDAESGAQPSISNCIFWNNGSDLWDCNAQYSCIEEGGAGEGNISEDPLFADPCNGDYHLLSERGRYRATTDEWILDKVTSPCIDGGDPTIEPTGERMPNGARVNMGAYGNTAYASMSEWSIKGDANYDGVFDFVDFAILAQGWLEKAAWKD